MNITQWAIRNNISANALAELSQILNPTAHLQADNTGKSEVSVQANLRVIASRCGNSLWRNNSGAVTTDDGRFLRFGLGNDSEKLNKQWKSSDLIGITRMQSTRAGQIFGVLTAIECKKPGWSNPVNTRERAQAAFHANVKALGGIAGFAQSAQDYERMVRI